MYKCASNDGCCRHVQVNWMPCEDCNSHGGNKRNKEKLQLTKILMLRWHWTSWRSAHSSDSEQRPSCPKESCRTQFDKNVSQRTFRENFRSRYLELEEVTFLRTQHLGSCLEADRTSFEVVTPNVLRWHRKWMLLRQNSTLHSGSEVCTLWQRSLDPWCCTKCIRDAFRCIAGAECDRREPLLWHKDQNVRILVLVSFLSSRCFFFFSAPNSRQRTNPADWKSLGVVTSLLLFSHLPALEYDIWEQT